ncbi:hypothetical protein CGLO_06056 [Colletotrichum gloeosporioides Cg-14]|uniref:Uncharacterized protein n=1 Tax=Colletotrichum gloeosporioides (strain Cg-14) TaxID=1237896 RepID=T0KQ60_COLGC|nr:hypothetical protein CGLO_06056 [Colletotrichum gloeosporioides Cg-14]
MSDIQIFSFRPKEAPQHMPLRETPPGKVGPASLPRELFLKIVDSLVDDVTAWETPASWKLEYCYDAPSKLVVKEQQMTIAEASHSQNKRFQRSRNQELHVRQAMTLPTPTCESLINSIQRLHFPKLEYISRKNAAAIASFAALPHLREISTVVGNWAPDYNERIVHHGIRKIDQKTYPTLHNWAQRHESTFASIFRPLKNKGVKLLVDMMIGDNPFLEICDTEKGIRIKTLIANCNCCSHDKLY